MAVPRLIQARSAEPIALESLSKQLGEWQCVQQQVELTRGGKVPEGKEVVRVYRDGAGAELVVILKATYTRLGAIKDYSLARVAQGWTETAERTAPLGAQQQCRLQFLQRGTENEIVASVYCSPREVVPDFRGAELAAARDRLLGQEGAWGQAYVVADVGESTTHEEATQRIIGFLTELAAELQQVLAAS